MCSSWKKSTSLFPESGVFVLKPVFILLAIFNIGGCAIPNELPVHARL